ncbi:hypothetical protein [Laceyella putida]|uniref:Uncharacterized protein n=1 Tax=Laceyella putida TaxID=110101 RepID=A0ABW2RJV0_9BACL
MVGYPLHMVVLPLLYVVVSLLIGWMMKRHVWKTEAPPSIGGASA